VSGINRSYHSRTDNARGMQECFRAYPDVYGAELEDDEDDDSNPSVKDGVEEAPSTTASRMGNSGSLEDKAEMAKDAAESTMASSVDQVEPAVDSAESAAKGVIGKVSEKVAGHAHVGEVKNVSKEPERR
jgi:hypothetical protein